MLQVNEDIMDKLKLKGAQKRVVPLIMQGLSNEEIARKLYLSAKGVKFQITQIYKMVGLNSRAQFMAGMTKLGWQLEGEVPLPSVQVEVKYSFKLQTEEAPSLVGGHRG